MKKIEINKDKEYIMIDTVKFTKEYFKAKLPEIITIARQSESVDELRASLARLAHNMMFETFDDYDSFNAGSICTISSLDLS